MNKAKKVSALLIKSTVVVGLMVPAISLANSPRDSHLVGRQNGVTAGEYHSHHHHHHHAHKGSENRHEEQKENREERHKEREERREKRKEMMEKRKEMMEKKKEMNEKPSVVEPAAPSAAQ